MDQSANRTHVEVSTPVGTVRGTSDGMTDRFLGIPYAEAPTGSLRLAAPSSVVPWGDVLDATEPGATPLRAEVADLFTSIPEPAVPGSSILNASVFTPSVRDGVELLPVMVWIHGGGYIGGSPASPWYDGAEFVRRGIVTVNLSYRLGVDGFGSLDGAPTNRGMRDLVAGLRWVRDHIASFGGDPERVTVAGQSAGGGAVLTLMDCPEASGLFSAGIALSPAVGDVPLVRSREATNTVATALGIPPTRHDFSQIDESAVERVRIDVEDIDWSDSMALARSFLDPGMAFAPVIDGDLLPHGALWPAGIANGAEKPLLLGATDGEFSDIFSKSDDLDGRNPAHMLRELGISDHAATRILRDHASDSPARVLGRAVTDLVFRGPVAHIARERARRGAQTWLYDFARPPMGHDITPHCADVPAFFAVGDTHLGSAADGTDFFDDAVTFIKTRRAPWSPFTLADSVTKVYGRPSTVVVGHPWPQGPAATRGDALDAHLRCLLERLTLERKVELLTGSTFWSTAAIEEVGLRSMVLSDGPSGVRGEWWDERDPSVSFPSATALSASWKTDLARRYGEHAAKEARRKGVDVVLGPTINLHRSPLGGRSFESFSEDPLLTSDLAAAYVDGVQSRGVGATPKHFVANDFETDRLTASVTVSDRALRELYLRAFEGPVRDSKAWLVMSAYNAINGVTATESPLLQEILSDEWGFDGVVVSDWGAVRSVAAARGRQDLVMPGPEGPWGAALIGAVGAGDIPVRDIDQKVLRILLLAARVGALDSVSPMAADHVAEDSISFVREAAASGMVLVHNAVRDMTPTLPLSRRHGSRIAVCGQAARYPRIQGGGSATVLPEEVISPLEGISRAAHGASVTYAPGVAIADDLLDFPLERINVPGTTQNGVLVQLMADGREIHREIRGANMLVDLDPEAPLSDADMVVVTTEFTPGDTGWMPIGFAAAGRTVLSVNGRTVLDATLEVDGIELGASFLSPPIASWLNEIPGKVLLRYEHHLSTRPSDLFFSFAYGLDASSDGDRLIVDAVAAARDADVAVVVVGTNSRVEAEGSDRTDLSLPGRQDELVRSVAATGTPTVVVVNSGAPVLLPWRSEVDAIVLSWFGGQEYGHALADVLFGDREPTGRLPMTWPDGMDDVPVLDVTPREGVLRYDEGVYIGYRAWLRNAVRPAYPFGFGLGYTTFEMSAELCEGGDAGTILLDVFVQNTGDRDGRHVIQVYVAGGPEELDLPARRLVAFQGVVLAAGERRHVPVEVDRRSFAYWDSEKNGWADPDGPLRLIVARSAEDEGVEIALPD